MRPNKEFILIQQAAAYVENLEEGHKLLMLYQVLTTTNNQTNKQKFKISL